MYCSDGSTELLYTLHGERTLATDHNVNMEEHFTQPTSDELDALAKFMPAFEVVETEIDQHSESAETETFEFKVFNDTDQVIINEPPEWTTPKRPLSYYLQPKDAARLEQMKSVAIDASQIHHDASIPWSRCSRPDKVTHIPAQAKRNKWRPSKRRRDKYKMKNTAKSKQELKVNRHKIQRTKPQKPRHQYPRKGPPPV